MKKKLKLQHFITLTRRISKLKPAAVLHWSVLLDLERTEFAWIFPSQLWLCIVSIFKVHLLFFNFQHGCHFSNKWVRDFIIWFRIQCGHEGQSNTQYSCFFTYGECERCRTSQLYEVRLNRPGYAGKLEICWEAGNMLGKPGTSWMEECLQYESGYSHNSMPLLGLQSWWYVASVISYNVLQ